MERVRSWVSSLEDQQERRQHAAQLEGLELAAVRYVDIDYRRADLAEGQSGPRRIVNEVEWREPTWQYPSCDSLDFGLELETTSGRVFSVAWDPPGWTEGLGIRELPLFATAVVETADVAIWDVGQRSRWAEITGRLFTGVVLHYLPWNDPAGFWCPRISLQFDERVVELLLGEGRPGSDEVCPSADNVAVLFDPPGFPDWVQARD